MVTVKFFGLISVDYNIRQLTVKAGKVSDAIKEIIRQRPDISEGQLIQAVMVINKKPVSGRKRLFIELEDGDELVFLSSVSGG